MLYSRDEIRRVYLDVWRRMQRREVLEPMQALIAEIIDGHPEYHALLDDDLDTLRQEFTPAEGGTNPFLHMGMHIALREQANSDRPAGIAGIYRRLVARLGQHEAEHVMMDCLGESLWRAQRDNQPPDETAYLECLRRL